MHGKLGGALAHQPEAEKARMVYFLKYLVLFYIALRYLVNVSFNETQNLTLEKLVT